MKNAYVIDHDQYLLGRDKNGTTHYISEIQDVVFPIVLEIDRICRKNNIPYALVVRLVYITIKVLSLGMMTLISFLTMKI